ncbi:hypothetical protein [uncultured Psychroserpens sp.]|uniref:hypothetical protein n=1 Tax=uncultured Psychroserpens sp. TaxID=255436 RepID=UPI00261F0EE6|nr:hypothetical protein [uncultured Psychroserpens sp.]
MRNQGQRQQDFVWRPNTNDSTTLARYDQEASQWVRAFRSASRPKPTLLGTMGTIGLLVQLAMNLILLVVLLIGKAFKWTRRR